MFHKKDTQTKEQKSGSVNIVGEGTEITGNLSTNGDIRIDGKIIGDVRSKAKVVVGITGTVEGNIYSNEAELAGKVNGNVDTAEILFLKASSKLDGNISSNKLVIENGADFTGHCQTGLSLTKSIFDGKEKESGKTQEATA